MITDDVLEGNHTVNVYSASYEKTTCGLVVPAGPLNKLRVVCLLAQIYETFPLLTSSRRAASYKKPDGYVISKLTGDLSRLKFNDTETKREEVHTAYNIMAFFSPGTTNNERQSKDMSKNPYDKP